MPLLPACLAALGRTKVTEFERLPWPRDVRRIGLDPFHKPGKGPGFPEPVPVTNPNPDSISLLQFRGPLRFQVVIAPSRTAKSLLQRPRGKGIHVGILKTDIPGVSRRSKLYTDAMPRVLAGPFRNHALSAGVPMSYNLAGNTQVSREFFILEASLPPARAEDEAIANILQSHTTSLGRRLPPLPEPADFPSYRVSLAIVRSSTSSVMAQAAPRAPHNCSARATFSSAASV